jgi:glutamine amidotransferase
MTIINYGLGNIRAFENVFERLNIAVRIATNKDELKVASKIILPGVGAFDHAMIMLKQSGMKETLDEMVLEKKIPVLGICVGMQMLARSSDEGLLPGLGWIDGHVKKFNPELIKFKTRLPHMGWNTINPSREDILLKGLNSDSRFYFLHSYYFQCNNSENEIARTEYGIPFACGVKLDNIYGLQFHPEKSHENGIQILHNFANL